MAAAGRRSWRLDPRERIHLIGIGGAGMSALAGILLERGHVISGSDLRGGRAAQALVAMGAQVGVGHAAGNVDGAAVVVVSTAVPETNPEVVRARNLGVPVIRRAELLAALMEGRRRLLVAGTHGKTTTTSMVTVALQAGGEDPSFAIGGTIHDSGTSGHHGTGNVFVAEADESDRSFLAYTPDCAVITNVELDHHDTYADLAQVRQAFEAFLDRRPAEALAVVCADDTEAASLARVAAGPVLTYGTHPSAGLRVVDLTLDEAGSRCLLSRDGEVLGRLALAVAGRHNVLNAAAATAAALWAGAAFDDIARGLAEFRGAQRRFQRIGTAEGVTVVDDYGHHPTELAATLDAARQTAPGGRVLAIFQPHRYSRTAVIGVELGSALARADVAVVTDVYPAGEAPVPGVTGALVATAAREAGVETLYIPSLADLPAAVTPLLRDGDLVVTMGAGDITEVGPLLLRRLLEGPPLEDGDRG